VTGSPEDVAGCSDRLLLPNITQAPNVVLDRWMASMTGAEIKVVLYVVRHTYDFRRTSDRISVAQMSMGHGSFSTTMKYCSGGPGRPAKADRRGPLKATFRSLKRACGGPYSRQTPNGWRNRRRSCRRNSCKTGFFGARSAGLEPATF
jgi:hypothetical protein